MTILQALNHYYDRLAQRGDVVVPGWSVEPVGIVIVLAADGTLINAYPRLDEKGKRPLSERVPKWFGRSGKGSTPYFLWDNTAYALGVSDKDPGKTSRDHAAFRSLHLNVLEGEKDAGLSAVRAFIEAWTPERFKEPFFDSRMLTWNVCFQLESTPREFIHRRPIVNAIVERLRAASSPSKRKKKSVSLDGGQQCLITGTFGPIATLHTKIKGVNGTASAEVPLTSFNEKAFESYGKSQAENAPASMEAVARYSAALNALLDRNALRNRLQRTIGDATVAFWADTSETVDEAAAVAAEEAFVMFADPPSGAEASDDDAQEAVLVRDALDKLAAGRPVEDLGLGLRTGTRFHVLGLAPNAARLSVRFWLEDSFEVFAKRLAQHHRDLAIEPRPRGLGNKPASIARLLVKTTALLEKFDNIPHHLAGEVMRSVLSGAPYPRTLLTAAITRLRAGDDPGSGWHAAAIKACINRPIERELERLRQEGANPERQTELKKEKLPVSREPDREDTPYQLGRLFAVLESAQYAALGKVNAPIGDRYYASASSTPARVFGTLLRGLKNHIADARKRGQGGWIEPKVGEIMLMLPPELPRTMKLEDQGRFAIGYYHERATRAPKAGDGAADQEDQKQ